MARKEFEGCEQFRILKKCKSRPDLTEAEKIDFNKPNPLTFMTLKCLYIIKLTGFANKYIKPLSVSVGFVPFGVCVCVIVREREGRLQ